MMECCSLHEDKPREFRKRSYISGILKTPNPIFKEEIEISSMSKALKTLIIIVTLLLLCLIITPFYMGIRIQKQLKTGFQAFNTAHSNTQIHVLSDQRGWFHSKVQVNVLWSHSDGQGHQVLEHHIHTIRITHGPIFIYRRHLAFGLARYQMQLTPIPQVQAQVEGRIPFNGYGVLHAKISFDHALIAAADVPQTKQFGIDIQFSKQPKTHLLRIKHIRVNIKGLDYKIVNPDDHQQSVQLSIKHLILGFNLTYDANQNLGVDSSLVVDQVKMNAVIPNLGFPQQNQFSSLTLQHFAVKHLYYNTANNQTLFDALMHFNGNSTLASKRELLVNDIYPIFSKMISKKTVIVLNQFRGRCPLGEVRASFSARWPMLPKQRNFITLTRYLRYDYHLQIPRLSVQDPKQAETLSLKGFRLDANNKKFRSKSIAQLRIDQFHYQAADGSDGSSQTAPQSFQLDQLSVQVKQDLNTKTQLAVVQLQLRTPKLCVDQQCWQQSQFSLRLSDYRWLDDQLFWKLMKQGMRQQAFALQLAIFQHQINKKTQLSLGFKTESPKGLVQLAGQLSWPTFPAMYDAQHNTQGERFKLTLPKLFDLTHYQGRLQMPKAYLDPIIRLGQFLILENQQQQQQLVQEQQAAQKQSLPQTQQVTQIPSLPEVSHSSTPTLLGGSGTVLVTPLETDPVTHSMMALARLAQSGDLKTTPKGDNYLLVVHGVGGQVLFK